MDELDAFELEEDTEKEALVSKLAVISLMDREARIDEWSDRDAKPNYYLCSRCKGCFIFMSV